TQQESIKQLLTAEGHRHKAAELLEKIRTQERSSEFVTKMIGKIALLAVAPELEIPEAVETIHQIEVAIELETKSIEEMSGTIAELEVEARKEEDKAHEATVAALNLQVKDLEKQWNEADEAVKKSKAVKANKVFINLRKTAEGSFDNPPKKRKTKVKFQFKLLSKPLDEIIPSVEKLIQKSRRSAANAINALADLQHDTADSPATRDLKNSLHVMNDTAADW